LERVRELVCDVHRILLKVLLLAFRDVNLDGRRPILEPLTNNKSPTVWRWTVGQCVYIGGYEEVVLDLPATTGLR